MRRIAAMALTIGALLALSACQTDNTPPVVGAPPPQPAADAPPSPATIAWAGQMVGAALAAEKSARDAGKDENGVEAAIQATIVDQAQAYLGTGASPAQIFVGARLAAADPRNTPATAHVFRTLDWGAFLATPVGSSGHCTGCKGVN